MIIVQISILLVLYRLLNTNRLPFLDTEKQLLNPNERRNAIDRRLRGEELPAPCEASPAMADLILRACAYEPTIRFTSATEMKQALMNVSNGTYQIANTDNLDRTTSVRRAPADYDRITSVRKTSTTVNQKSGQLVNTFGPISKKNKFSFMIAMAIVIVGLIGVGIFVMPKLIDDNESVESSQSSDNILSETDNTLSEKVDYSKFDEEKIDSIITAAEILATEEDYEGALNKIQIGLITYPKSEVLQEKSEEYTIALNVQIKEETLKKAEALADVGDYASAMVIIETAQNTYGSNKEYEEAYILYQKSFALTTAESYATSGDLPNAITTIVNAQEDNSTDVDLIIAYNSYSSNYVAEVITEIDALMNERNYSAAIEVVNKGLKILPNNQSLMDKLTEINSSKPTSLSNLLVFNGGWEWNNLAPTDPFGNDYSSACNYVVFSDYWKNILPQDGHLGEVDGYRQIYAEYHTDGKYNYLTMQLAPYSTICSEGRVFIQVYADDELVYTSPIITRKTEAFVCEIDISGSEYVKILVNVYIGEGIDGEDEGAIIISDAQFWPN